MYSIGALSTNTFDPRFHGVLSSAETFLSLSEEELRKKGKN
jgi:hypothetical protein